MDVALLTRHGKEAVLAPVLAQLGWRLGVTRDFDTDTLGTFSRTVPRTTTAVACAREKARLAMQLTGAPRGLGSEGSYGAGPWGPIVPWGREILVLIDAPAGMEIAATTEGPATIPSQSCRSVDEVLSFAAAQPVGQHFLLRPDDEQHRTVHGAVIGETALRTAAAACLARAATGSLFIEWDLRAHCSPSRRARIGEAAENLVARVRSRCPACDAPGFWQVDVVRGLPCRACGTATERAKARIKRCLRCPHEALENVSDEADPRHCPWCNP